jgi:hypothetical protein
MDSAIGVLKFPIVEQFNELSELPLVTCHERTVSRPAPLWGADGSIEGSISE